jgi:hypothetical protein
MADFYYQTSLSVRGPWLLDSAQLSELDTIVIEQWKRLNEYRDKKIEREVEQALPSEIESAYPKPEKRRIKKRFKMHFMRELLNVSQTKINISKSHFF